MSSIAGFSDTHREGFAALAKMLVEMTHLMLYAFHRKRTEDSTRVTPVTLPKRVITTEVLVCFRAHL